MSSVAQLRPYEVFQVLAPFFIHTPIIIEQEYVECHCSLPAY